jgi:hypothetical protein
MAEQPSTMTALKPKTKSQTKMKIRRKLQKINLPEEIRYVQFVIFIIHVKLPNLELQPQGVSYPEREKSRNTKLLKFKKGWGLVLGEGGSQGGGGADAF